MDFGGIWELSGAYWALYGMKILYAIIILVLGIFIAKRLKNFVMKILKRREVEPTLGAFVANLAYAMLVVFIILAALSKLGIETTSFVAIVGAAGLAIGLALQGSLANFAAGFLLIMFKPIKAGEFVEAGGAAGVVDSISIFTTVMKSPDNVEITIPNSQVLSNTIKNFSRQETRRIDLIIGVGYKDDLKKVKSVLHAVIEEDARILKEPEVTIAVGELGDSSVNFVVRPWVKGVDYWAVRGDLLEAIKLRFDAEGINIPYPQRDIHIIDGKAA